MVKRLVILLILILLPVWAMGATYYVRSDGHDSCNGLADAPDSRPASCAVKTLWKAGTLAKSAGDIVNVRNGDTFVEAWLPGTEAVTWQRYQSSNGSIAPPIVAPSSGTRALYINGLANGITIDGFRIADTQLPGGSVAACVSVNNSGNGTGTVVLKNMTASCHFGVPAFRVYQSKVTGTNLIGNGTSPFDVDPGSAPASASVFDCTDCIATNPGVGYCTTGDSPCTGAWVTVGTYPFYSGAECTEGAENCGVGWSTSGFKYSNASTGTLTRPKAYYSGQDCYQLNDSANVIMVRPYAAYCGQASGYDYSAGDGYTTHNTSHLTLIYPVGHGSYKSGLTTRGTSTGEVYNGVFAYNFACADTSLNNANYCGFGLGLESAGAWTITNTISAGNKWDIWVLDTAKDHVTLTNNLYYELDNWNAGKNFMWGNYLTPGQSWVEYLAAGAVDTNVQHADPLFRSATDFRPKSGSPAINKGTDVGLTTDYIGKTIRGVPDIGAYEFYGSGGRTLLGVGQ